VTCQLYENELSAYLDGELPATRAARLEAHLRVCPHCQGELNELSGISSYIRSASREIQVSREFDQRVLRAVGYFQIAGRQRRQRSWLRPLVIVAMALLALLSLVQHFLVDRPATPLPQPQGARAVGAPIGPVAPVDGRER
jgi:anti-sigma factor RsiW